MDSVLPMPSIVVGSRAEVVIILISGASRLGSRFQVVLYTPSRGRCRKAPCRRAAMAVSINHSLRELPGSCGAVTTAVLVPAPYV